MRAVQYFFLYVSLFLLLAHSFVPHAHEHEPEGASPPTKVIEAHPPLNILDWLAIAFQQDLGEDHLEIYQPAFKYLADSLFPLMKNQEMHSNQPAIQLLQELDYQPYRAPYYLRHLRSSTGSRGPPST